MASRENSFQPWATIIAFDMKMKLTLLSMFVLLTVLCQAQNAISTIDSLLFDSQFDRAMAEVDKALQKTSNIEDRIVLENKKAEILIRGGRFDDAERQLKSI